MLNKQKISGKKGIFGLGAIISIALITLAAIVILMIIGSFEALKAGISEQFQKSDVKESNDASFVAEMMKFSPEENTCVQADDDAYECDSQALKFITTVSNQGTNQNTRAFYGGFVVCLCEDEDCRIKSTDECFQNIIKSPERCSIRRGESKDCPAASYYFGTGTYKVYPAAVCDIEDPSLGCTAQNNIQPKNINDDDPFILAIK